MHFSLERRVGQRAASLFEVAVFILVIGFFSSFAVRSIHSMAQSACSAHLEADLFNLNEAVSDFRSQGGVLADDLSMGEVINLLKNPPARPERTSTFVNLIGDMVPVMQSAEEAASDQRRIRWNRYETAFELATSGTPGVKAFLISPTWVDAATPVSPALDTGQ